MGKGNLLTVLAIALLQSVLGYLWYSPFFFGDVLSGGGHALTYINTDVFSTLLLLISSFGLTLFFDGLVKSSGSKTVNSAIKLGLTVGLFGMGLPTLVLLSALGFGKVALLVVLIHTILLSVLTSLLVIKLNK